MCDPLTLALTAQAAGGLMSAGAQKNAAEANADVLQQNQNVAKWQAKNAQIKGAFDEQQLKQQIGQIIGSQRAGFAGGGIAVDSGTALAIQEDTSRQGALDVAQIKLNAANEAWGYKIRAKSFGYQKDLTKQEGTQAALGTLLGTAGSVYSTYKLGSG